MSGGGTDDTGHDPAELGELVVRMARGSQGALARFYDVTVGRAYALALCIVHDEAAALEAVEEAYVAAWREAAVGAAGPGGALAWLLALVRRRGLELVRQRPPPPALGVEGEPPPGPARHDDCGQDLMRMMARGSGAAAALARLSPQARRMLGLAFFRGLTHQEISVICDLPLATVEAAMAQACLQLAPPALAGAPAP